MSGESTEGLGGAPGLRPGAAAHAGGPGGPAVLRGVGATLTGLAAALVFALVLSRLSDGAGLSALAALLGLSALLYVRPAVRDGRPSKRLLEASVFAFTVAAAALGRWDSPAFMAAGYLVHGVWDICHQPFDLGARVKVSWLPKACASFDLFVAAFILFRYVGDAGRPA